MQISDYKLIADLQTQTESNAIKFDDVEQTYQELFTTIVEPLRQSHDNRWYDIENLIVYSQTSYETQGFINGFRSAMQLFSKC